MLKKMMLLAMAVAALVAFSVPAAASASTEWDTDGVSIEGEDEVHFSGTLSSTKGGVRISCDATANTVLWNDASLGAHGLAELILLNQHGPTVGCTVAAFVSGVGYVPVSGCHVKPSSAGAPWTVSTSTGGNVAIAGANFLNEFKGCASALKIPDGTKLGAEGTATGTVNGAGCIVFNESGDMKDPGGAPVSIDGSLCPTEPGLELTG